MCRVKKKKSELPVSLRALSPKYRYPLSEEPAKIPLSSWSPVPSLRLASQASLPEAHANDDVQTQIFANDHRFGKVLVMARVLPSAAG